MFKKQLINKQRPHGFTLLEIMLVLLLMGMISMGVVMTMPNTLISQDNLDWQAQRLRTLLQFAEDEALISGLELGLEFAENSYQFVFFDYKNKNWQPVLSKQIQGKVELPESIEIEYDLAGSLWDEIDTEKQDDFIDEDYLVSIEGEKQIVSFRPQVYIMSSGEVTPFSLTFSNTGKDAKQQSIIVSVSMNGAITLTELQK